MAGLALRVGGFGGVGSTDSPAYGTPQSYDSVTQQAFGPGVTLPAASASDILSPTEPFGVAVWTGVACVALLILIRRSLPR
jgi:hypothetical protein